MCRASFHCLVCTQKFTISKKNRKLATVHALKSPKTVLRFLCEVFFVWVFFVGVFCWFCGFFFTGIASSRTNSQRILAL